MKYIASVRDKETKKVITIEAEYNTKKEFAIDLRQNGYGIRFISTPEKFDDDAEKYYQACESTKLYHKTVYDLRKKAAERFGMTMKEYMEGLK